MSTPSGPSKDPTPSYPSYPGEGGSEPMSPAAPASGPDPSAQPPAGRPATVTWAAWTTIVLSAVGIVSSLGFAIAAGPIADYVRDHPDELDLTSSDIDQLDGLEAAVAGLAVVLLIAAVIAIVVAALVLRRQAWARITLVVLAALTIILGLVFTIGAIVGLPWFAGGIAVVVLLFTGGANEWFAPRTPQAPVPPEVP